MSNPDKGGTQPRQGGCLCGAVRFTAMIAGTAYGVCHCSICRKWSGGPFFAVECESLHVADDGRLGLYRSSEWAERGFCTACGSVLFYRLVAGGMQAASLEALDDSAGFTFASEIFVDEQPAHYAFANETHKMTGAEVFAQFDSGTPNSLPAGTGDGHG